MSLPHEAPRQPLQALFPLAEVPSRLPRRRGRALHRSAPYRWASPGGLAGVRLRTVFIGGELHTTEQWLMEFFEAVTEARRGTGESARTLPSPVRDRGTVG